MTGPACGNNPHYRMSDGDRQAVDSFRAYLTARAALRDRIAKVLWPLTDWDGDELNAERAADAVLAVLPGAVDRAAVLREAAGVAERLMDDRYGPDCSYAIGGPDVARELRRVADETAATETQPPGTVTIEMLAGALAAHTDLLIGALGEGVASIAVVPTEIAGMRRTIDLLKLHKSRLLNLQEHADLIRRLGPFLAAFTDESAAGAQQDGAESLCDHDSQVIDHEGDQYWACLKCGTNLGRVEARQDGAQP
ncbi:hypothetical protein RKD37_001728 [Streptomyces ambofaciens]